jgi:molybdenum cofactor guanylyltransferase
VKPVGLLLAGGQSRRMGGGDKALRLLGGISLLDRAIARLRPQVEALVLNANGDPGRFAGFGLPVAADSVPGFAGPLAGVLAGLARLVEGSQAKRADLACAASGGREHPVFGLWPVRLRDELRHAVVVEGVRKVDDWTGRYKLVTVPFADHPIDPFFNANRPEDLATAAALAATADTRLDR